MIALVLLGLSFLLVGARADDEIRHVGIVTLPEFGHFMPPKSVAEYIAANHPNVRITVYTNDHKAWNFTKYACNNGHAPWKCVCFANVDASEYVESDFLEKISMSENTIEIFQEVQKHVHKFHQNTASLLEKAMIKDKPDILLVDVGMYSGLTMAHRLGIPVVLIYPLTLWVPFQIHTSFAPSIGLAMTANSLRESFWRRYFNHLYAHVLLPLGQYYEVTKIMQETNPLYPSNGALWNNQVIVTPSIFGLDFPQPLCPNIRPVGFLLPTSDLLEAPSESAFPFRLKTKSLLYINMGSVGKLSERAVVQIYEAVRILLAEDGEEWSVVWKYRGPHLSNFSIERTDRFYLTESLPFSPRWLLHTYNTSTVFVTHCGDTSVYESLEALVPMVGIPLFADQPDMCQRVHESGIGIAMTGQKNTFIATDLVRNVKVVRKINDNSKDKLTKLRSVGISMGGPRRVWETLQEVYLWRNVRATSGRSHLSCPYVDNPNWFAYLEVDVLLVDFFICAVIVKLFSLLFTLCRRKKAGGVVKKDKKD